MSETTPQITVYDETGKLVQSSLEIVTAPAIPLLAEDPESPSEGDVWYNTDEHVLKYFDGSDVQTVAVES